MKDWEELLIEIYILICDVYEKDLKWSSQRYSNNSKWQELKFTDEEALTVYLFGLIRKRHEIKQIHTYAKDHLKSWFPDLPSYQKFNERLNRLSPSLERLANYLMEQIEFPQWLIQSQSLIDTVVDSMPIIIAKGSRADSAKVAIGIANKGYCSSKKLWYHGFKLHHLGVCIPTTIPKPLQFVLSAASENDNIVFKEQMAPMYRNLRVYGDKIYHDESAKKDLWKQFQIEVLACQKRKRGQKHLYADQKFFNTMISQIRQPIESFFNWLEQKTAIQKASKVRSLNGILKHIFGRLAAALICIIF